MSKDVSINPQAPFSELNGGYDEEWLTPEQFAKLGDNFPTTARGARMRLQRLTQSYPELSKKNPQRKGFLYHISLKDKPLPEAPTQEKPQQTEHGEHYNLWKQLYLSVPEEKQQDMLNWVLKEVSEYMSNKGK
ncbi:hypothetical protein J6836_08505 [Providencia sp. R33]|uniref:hypothetical protein n=1 Tax=Providencia sp. R33 TaxID=2828763 RepID=UPI001C5BD505|nr:hypothetical protein J6836_08505 [Providencia sp. R33]